MNLAFMPAIHYHSPILTACAASTRTALFECGRLVTFEPGTPLLGDGDLTGVVVFPLQGQLQMGKATARGRRQIICNPTEHSCDGMCMLMFGERGLADMKGLQTGQALIVQRADFERLVHDDPILCRAAWQSVTGCMAHLSGLVAQLSFDKVGERVIKTLLNETQQDGDMVRLTQTDLAAEVGTTREVVARCLAGLQDDGLVRLGRARITVLNRDGLKLAL